MRSTVGKFFLTDFSLHHINSKKAFPGSSRTWQPEKLNSENRSKNKRINCCFKKCHDVFILPGNAYFRWCVVNLKLKPIKNSFPSVDHVAALFTSTHYITPILVPPPPPLQFCSRCVCSKMFSKSGSRVYALWPKSSNFSCFWPTVLKICHFLVKDSKFFRSSRTSHLALIREKKKRIFCPPLLRNLWRLKSFTVQTLNGDPSVISLPVFWPPPPSSTSIHTTRNISNDNSNSWHQQSYKN